MFLQRVTDSLPPVGHTIILGDFNDDIRATPHTVIYPSLLEFTQCISSPTTSKATLLDHIYVRDHPSLWTAGVMHTYYSYHDITYYKFAKHWTLLCDARFKVENIETFDNSEKYCICIIAYSTFDNNRTWHLLKTDI